MTLSAPQPIQAAHITEHFACGVPALDAWLQYRALTNQQRGASRVFVSVDTGNRVQGYYALAAGEITHEESPGSIRRNMPDPIPVVILGRLAVHRDAQDQHLGRGLLRDAFLRATQAAEHISIRAMLVHAMDDSAKAFYLQYGFVETPINPLTLIMKLPL